MFYSFSSAGGFALKFGKVLHCKALTVKGNSLLKTRSVPRVKGPKLRMKILSYNVPADFRSNLENVHFFSLGIQ